MMKKIYLVLNLRVFKTTHSIKKRFSIKWF